MKIVGIIFSLMVVIWFWIWFFRQVFASLYAGSAKRVSQLAYTAILVGALAIYEWGIVLLPIASIKISHELLPSSIFFLWCVVVLVILLLIWGFQKEKKIGSQILIGLGSLGVLLGVLMNSGASNLAFFQLLPYYLILAHTEELFKFSLAHLEEGRQQQHSISSLLAFALLVGFSFALLENLLAFGVQIFQGSQISSGFLLGRGLISSMLHVVATGTIAFLMMKYRRHHWIMRYVMALLGGVVLHSVYNMSLALQYQVVGVMIALGGFTLLTYLLYHLDELYLPGDQK